MAAEITLGEIFEMQERAAGYNQSRSTVVTQRLAFVNDAVSITTAILSSPVFRDEKQYTLRVLGSDALSSIAASARVALWGDLPESVTLLRCALETCATLAAVVETQEYDVATHEMLAARMRQYSFERAVSRLGDVGIRLRELHGRLSEIGAHSSGTRLRCASYEISGQFYDRVGAALDPPSAELALFYAPDACMQLLQSIETAYLQASTLCPWSDRLTRLRQRFAQVKAGDPDVAP